MAKQLIFYITQKVEDGMIRRIGARFVHEIAKDLRKALEKAKMPFEYVSDVNWPKDQRWPIGERQTNYVWLEPGGNEGWSIFVATRYTEKPADFTNPWGYWKHDMPIRIKLLCGDDDAWRVVRFVQEIIDNW